LRHPDVYMLRDWHSFRLGGEFFDPHKISDRDFQWLAKDFDAISFEKGMTVREDHRNLFDNPEYQEKMTPRIMLEAAQKEFRDGYVEVWGEKDANVKSGGYGAADDSAKDKLGYLQSDTWKTYVALGEQLIDSNPDQAYLCYENALFLYEEDGRRDHSSSAVAEASETKAGTDATVRGNLTHILQTLRESGNVSVRKCAIVILSYNNTYLMQKCVESIRTHCNPEACGIVVLDNASTDGVTEWLKEQEDISLLLSDENLGFPAGCNEAIRTVAEEYDILLLNNDTRMTPNALFWLRMALYEKENVGAAGCVANYTDPSQRVDVTFPLPEEYVRYAAKINVPPAGNTEEREKLSGFALLLKRPVLEEVGLFDERFSPGYFEDTDLCLRIRKAGYRLLLAKNSFIYHAGSQSFMSRDDLEALFTRNYKYACEKWGEKTIAALFPEEPEETDAGHPPEGTQRAKDAVSSLPLEGKVAAQKALTDEVDVSKIKLIIWDLDDTFWDGILSEGDVRLRTDALALARRAVDMGIMNAICSKNDFTKTKKALEESTDGNLWELFVFPSVDWTPKGARVKQIIEDMALRAENVLFLDDSDFNLREAKHFLPEIMTGGPDMVPRLLRELSAGEAKDPQHKRLEQYRVLERKREDKGHAASNEQFLLDSEIRVSVDTHCLPHLERIADLVLRSNQLNYTKLRSSKEELREIIEDDAVSSGIVHAWDKYGDYGIVGFYALDLEKDRLIHFVFSCRALGMGVEQYVYERLGFPALEVQGEIASPLIREKKVRWITEEDAALKSGQDSAAVTGEAEGDIFIKGPCDMDQMIGFLQEKISAPLCLETNFVDERGVIVAGFNNLLHLKEFREYPPEVLQAVLSDAPFLSMDDFVTDMFDARHRVVFFSMLSESHAGVYRHKASGMRICFSSRNFDLTDPAQWERFISGEYPNHNFDFTKETLERFRETFVFEKGLGAEEVAELVQWLRASLPGTTQLVLLLGSETEAEENTEEFAEHAPLYHAVNTLLRERFADTPRLSLLNVTDVITGQECFAGCTNHFTRKVYYDLAERFASLIQ
ncbi:MAG: glycosyltransferase, partial [Lachnospiraceae bacterium]|nr:glycosyltransferase [Lachnospiraceae bacterium]